LQTALALLFVGLLIFLAHLFAAVFARTRVPDVLWLFGIGVVLGPVLGIVTPGSFGIVGPVFTTVTLVVLLFESGTDLHFDALRAAWRGTFALTTVNFAVSAALVGWALHECTDLGWTLALMTGSIVGSTSTAVIVALTRRLALQPAAGAVAVMESAFGDVFTLTIPLALLGARASSELDPTGLGVRLVVSFVVAVALGVTGAFAWSLLLSRVRNLQNGICTTPAVVFVVFGVVELLDCSGPVAALAFGVTLGNASLLTPAILARVVGPSDQALTATEKSFFSEAVFLLRTFFFVYAGLSIRFDDTDLLLLGLAVTVALFVARIPVVGISMSRATTARDASFLSVMIPKGLGAAILATLPLQMGVPGGAAIQTVVFSVILFSTLGTAVLVALVARTPLGRLYERVFLTLGFAREPPPGAAAAVLPPGRAPSGHD
jgi:NhaP-type Na+/H+ or K+/H+ antiporter